MLAPKLTKIQIVSDLHLETHKDCGKTLANMLPCLADVLVIAGDISNIPYLETGLKAFSSKWNDVVFVLGNHDYWNSGLSRAEVEQKVSEICDKYPNLHWLNRSAVTVQGQRFIGATQWFPMGAQAESLAPAFIDFEKISDLREWVNEEFNKTEKYFLDNVTREDIVITHHLPSYSCVVDKFQTGSFAPFNCFFFGPLDSVFDRKQPKLWVHGHTHEAIDRKINQTRVVCNPFGYLRMLCPEFNDQKVVEL